MYCTPSTSPLTESLIPREYNSKNSANLWTFLTKIYSLSQLYISQYIIIKSSFHTNYFTPIFNPSYFSRFTK